MEDPGCPLYSRPIGVIGLGILEWNALHGVANMTSDDCNPMTVKNIFSEQKKKIDI
jgi:hypothetical protein